MSAKSWFRIATQQPAWTVGHYYGWRTPRPLVEQWKQELAQTMLWSQYLRRVRTPPRPDLAEPNPGRRTSAIPGPPA